MFDAEKFWSAPIVRSTMDRNVDVLLRVVPRIVREFTNDALDRRPKGAGGLDLVSFLLTIAGRGATVLIPEYHATRPTTRKTGELVLPANRHGRVLAVVSNAKTFRFSLRIDDANVLTTASVGAPRTFTLTDFNGDLNDAWRTITFLPTARENSFLARYGLERDGRIPFERAVHPNRWTALFGRSYVLAKILIDRLSDEIKHWQPERRDLLAEIADEHEGDYRGTEREPGRKLKVQSLEVKVAHDVFLGEYPRTSDVTVRLAVLRTARERVQVATRATELAYAWALKRAAAKQSGWPAPSGLRWHTFKPPKSRITWQYMSLGGDLALQARIREITETVNE
jgi:hypothetical protein